MITVSKEIVEQVSQFLSNDKEFKSPTILTLRGMWLLEKVSRNKKLFKDSMEDASKMIFSSMVDILNAS